MVFQAGSQRNHEDLRPSKKENSNSLDQAAKLKMDNILSSTWLHKREKRTLVLSEGESGSPARHRDYSGHFIIGERRFQELPKLSDAHGDDALLPSRQDLSTLPTRPLHNYLLRSCNRKRWKCSRSTDYSPGVDLLYRLRWLLSFVVSNADHSWS